MLGENNEYGIIVENSSEGVYEGLKEVVSKPELLESYTKQAEIRGEKFSMQDTVDAVEDMLEEISNEKNFINDRTIKPFADVSYKDPKTRYMEYQKKKYQKIY